MSVATHLGIDLAEYDARIRTFIPYYEEMLEVGASVIDAGSRIIVDLGIGTGALSERCLAKAPQARIVGIDSDAEILKAAAQRLPASAGFVCGSFLSAEIPACDSVVASFALHHVRTRSAKARLYKRIADALERGGQMISVDCYPANDQDLSKRQFDAWKAHLMKGYTQKEAENYLEAWSHEDFYMSLDTEMELMRKTGFGVEILWRMDAFAIVSGRRR